PQGDLMRVSRSIEIDVTPDAFHRVVQDYARYPEFVPEVKAVRVGQRQGDSVDVTYWLDVKLKLFDFTLRHITRRSSASSGRSSAAANSCARTRAPGPSSPPEPAERGRPTRSRSTSGPWFRVRSRRRWRSGAFPTCSPISRPARRVSVKQRVEAYVAHNGYVD